MMVYWLHSSSLLILPPHPPSSSSLLILPPPSSLCGGLVRIDRSDPCLQPAGRDVCRRFLCYSFAYSLRTLCTLSVHNSCILSVHFYTVANAALILYPDHSTSSSHVACAWGYCYIHSTMFSFWRIYYSHYVLCENDTGIFKLPLNRVTLLFLFHLHSTWVKHWAAFIYFTVGAFSQAEALFYESECSPGEVSRAVTWPSHNHHMAFTWPSCDHHM